MFLQPDDHMMVQDVNAYAVWWQSDPDLRDLTLDELKKLRYECGITVAFLQCHWSRVEKEGKYDWSLIDESVNRFRNSGFKIVMQVPVSPPQDLEDLDLYGAGLDGAPYRGLLSFWNPAARDLTKEFMRATLNHYGGDDMNLCHAGLISEHYLWNAPVYLDKYAKQAFKDEYGEDITNYTGGLTLVPWPLRDFLRRGTIDFYVDMQRELVGQHQEIWDHGHYVIACQSQHNAGFARQDLYAAYQREFPNAQRMMMASTYFSHGIHNAHVVNDILSLYDAKIIVEAQYPVGLRGPEGGPSTTDWAIKGGLAPERAEPDRWIGQIVCPYNPFGDPDGFKELPQWKYDAIKGAVDKWAAAKAARCS